ncbi:MAG: histidine kinase dimerization/phospho-acceptor domain-containing protein, partial [Candidatus Omnitrophota bacterium]
MKRRLGLRTKLTLGFSFALAAITLTGIAIGYSWGYHLLRRTVERNQGKLAEFVSFHIKRDILLMVSLAEDIAGLRDGARLKAFTGKSGVFDDIALTDHQGAIIGRAAGTGGGLPLAGEGWWKACFEEGKTIVSTSGAPPRFVIAVPVRDIEGAPVGVCVAMIGIKRLFDSFCNIDPGGTGHVMVLDGRGDVLYHPGTDPHELKGVGEGIDTAAMKGNSGTALLKNVRIHGGEDMLLAWERLDTGDPAGAIPDWIIIVSISTEEAFRPLVILMRQLLSLAVILIALSLIIGSLFGGYFSRAVISFKKSIDSIGKNETLCPVDIRTGDELEDLADSFNLLLKKLNDSRAEMKDYTRSLELLVERRTKDLRDSFNEVQESRDVMLSILEDSETARNELEKTMDKLKETQGQLIQAGKLSGIGEVAAGVAHEINNPLTSILGFVQLIKSRQDTGPSTKDDLERVEGEAKRCVRIIENLLSFARPMPFTMTGVDVNNVVKDMLKVAGYLISVEKIDIEEAYCEGLPMVWGDANRLQQVFMN